MSTSPKTIVSSSSDPAISKLVPHPKPLYFQPPVQIVENNINTSNVLITNNTPGGGNGSIQINENGKFKGDPNLLYASGNLTVAGNVVVGTCLYVNYLRYANGVAWPSTGGGSSPGADGASGFSGIDGSQGAPGASGASGFSGIDGSQGAPGASGASGASGFSGIDGSQGAPGASGFSGIDGSQGAPGASGFSGINGTNGASSGLTGAINELQFNDNGVLTGTPNALYDPIRDIFLLKAANEYILDLGTLGTALSQDLDVTISNNFCCRLGKDMIFYFVGAQNYERPPTRSMVQSITIYIQQPEISHFSPIWPTGIYWQGGIIPAAGVTSNAIDIYTFITYTGGTTWIGLQQAKGLQNVV